MVIRHCPAQLHPELHPNLSLSESHRGYPLYRQGSVLFVDDSSHEYWRIRHHRIRFVL